MESQQMPPQPPIVGMPPGGVTSVIAGAGAQPVRPMAVLKRGPTPPVALRTAPLYWCLFGLALLIMLLGFLGSVGMGYLESGAWVFVAAIAAILPAPIYLGLLLWLDRFEPEPPALLILVFMWGAGVAGLIALFVNTGAEIGLMQFLSQKTAENTAAAVVGPIVEETLKGLAVAMVFFFRRSQFDDILDGIMYAGMAALGFAMVENIGYYGRGLHDGLAAFTATFVLRGIMSPYAHVLFTSMTGIGFGIAAQLRKGIFAWIAPPLGWCTAMILHATWNSVSIFGNEAFFIAYVILWIPLFLSFLAVIVWSLRRERALIRTHLAEGKGHTLLVPEDADVGSRLAPRLVADAPTLFKGGWLAWNNLRHYQRACTSLAFYRQRVSLGRMPANGTLETYYCEEIAQLRPAVKPAANGVGAAAGPKR